MTNVIASSTARIVIFWNSSTIKVDFVDCSAQCVHVVINSLVISFHATFVYGLHTIVDRRDLWDSLRMWCPSDPWLVLGDFNSILSQDDKLNGNAISLYETNDFHNCCHDLGLFDLNYSGCHFTWSNGHVWSKLTGFLSILFGPLFNKQPVFILVTRVLSPITLLPLCDLITRTRGVVVSSSSIYGPLMLIFSLLF